jgi:TolB protein
MTKAHLWRGLVAAGLVVAMSAFGVGVYQAAGYLKARHPQVQRPSQTTGRSLPGTIFVVQGGAIYRYSQGKFTQITSEAGWTQPAADPTGSRLVAVRRQLNLSDLYLLQLGGRAGASLTHDSSTVIESNHWAFYPRFSPDGSQIFYDYDPKDPYNSYRVDLAIFASPAGADTGSVQWTFPNQYTGGDVNPVPLRGGGLIYTRFSIDDQSNVHSQVWYQARPGSAGTPLTDLAEDCLQPAVSSDDKQVAMVCTHGQPQTAELTTASFYRATLSLGPLTVLVRGQVAASPAFAPDGKTIAYLAPHSPGGGFQLWTVSSVPSTAPNPQAISSALDLDAQSAPVWIS